MKFVLNGCSFCGNYSLAEKLGLALGYTEFVNLAQGGSSNRRIIRSTVEHIEESGANFVLVGLSFWDRQEAAVLQTTPHGNNWVSYNSHGIQGTFAPPDSKFIFGNIRMDVEKHLKNSYRYTINLSVLDQLMCDLLMFTSYLEKKNVRYLIYNSCELDYADYWETINSRYRTAIESIPRIIPLDKFISNMYLHSLGADFAPDELRWQPNAIHYNGEEYHHLNKYFIKYLQENNL